MADGTAETRADQNLTDGFHLLIDALKLNGVETIYNVPGIPITDLGRVCPLARQPRARAMIPVVVSRGAFLNAKAGKPIPMPIPISSHRPPFGAMYVT